MASPSKPFGEDTPDEVGTNIARRGTSRPSIRTTPSTWSPASAIASASRRLGMKSTSAAQSQPPPSAPQPSPASLVSSPHSVPSQSRHTSPAAAAAHDRNRAMDYFTFRSVNRRAASRAGEGGEVTPDEQSDAEDRVGGERRAQRPKEGKMRWKDGVSEWAGKMNPRMTLENSGSVARDHLAAERTFLAYVRTSLAIASTGVALVQLFTISASSSSVPMTSHIQRFARPLGATTVIMGFFVLLIGFVRYFRIQKALIKGFFPPARQTVMFMTVVLALLVSIVFSVLVAVPR